MNLYSIPNLIISILVFCLGLLVYNKNARNQANRGFFYIALSTFFWLFFAFLAYNCKNKSVADIYFRVCYAGIVNIGVTGLFFTLNFLRGSIKSYARKIILILGIFLAFLAIFTNLIVKGLHEFYWGYYPAAGVFHPFFLIFFVIIYLKCIFLLFSYLFSSGVSNLKKVQIKHIIIAFLIFCFASIDFIANYGIEVFPLGFIPVSGLLIIIAYSIIRYRFLDVSLVITRTGIFIAVYSLVLGTPFVLAYAARPYLLGFFGESWWLAPMGLMTVLATVGPFIYIFFNSKAEERLMREQRRYQSTLRQASSGMIRIRDLQRLLHLIVHVVARTVKIEFAAIFLYEPDNHYFSLAAKRGQTKFVTGYIMKDTNYLIKYLNAHREPLVFEEIQLRSQDMPNDAMLAGLSKELSYLSAAVVVPSYIGRQLLGFLVLGKKLSGKLYSQDDLNVFSVLANQSALAIENAQFYEDIKETQEQLFQAEKMATIGTMADGLSHQINNRFQALSLIAGDSLDILKTTELGSCSPEVKESYNQLKYAFERIQANVMQGGEVVRGLLRYSRPGQAGFDQVDFNRVFNGALEMAQYKVRIGELDIKKDIPEDLPFLRCNLTQLQEVFFNLIDNAYDAIKEKESILKDPAYKGTIELSAFQKNGSVHIIFKDNGAGVKENDKEKLFTPFFTTKSSNRKGTGLGLYVIQKIIGYHGGTIIINSVHMEGTKFEIVLPLSATEP